MMKNYLISLVVTACVSLAAAAQEGGDSGNTSSSKISILRPWSPQTTPAEPKQDGAATPEAPAEPEKEDEASPGIQPWAPPKPTEKPKGESSTPDADKAKKPEGEDATPKQDGEQKPEGEGSSPAPETPEESAPEQPWSPPKTPSKPNQGGGSAPDWESSVQPWTPPTPPKEADEDDEAASEEPAEQDKEGEATSEPPAEPKQDGAATPEPPAESGKEGEATSEPSAEPKQDGAATSETPAEPGKEGEATSEKNEAPAAAEMAVLQEIVGGDVVAAYHSLTSSLPDFFSQPLVKNYALWGGLASGLIIVGGLSIWLLLRSKSQARGGLCVRISYPDGRSREYSISMRSLADQPPLTAGSSPQCTLRIDDMKVSPQHFMLEVNSDGLCIYDLNSENGTIIHGERVSTYSHPYARGVLCLTAGDSRVSIGFVNDMSQPAPPSSLGGEPTEPYQRRKRV